MDISSLSCTFYRTTASEQRTTDKFPSPIAACCQKRGLIRPEQQRLRLASGSFPHSTKDLICGVFLSDRWTVPITIVAWRSWALMSSSWQPDNIIRTLPCLPASSVASLPSGRNCARAPFSLFSKKAFAHKALSGKNLDEEQLHTGFFPCESSRILRHGGVFTAYVSCRCCRFSEKKKRNKSNYGLIHMLQLGWKASHLFIKCWRLSFIGLQPQMIL